MPLGLVGPDSIPMAVPDDGVPPEFPSTPLQQTIDSMLAYADHLEGQSNAILELAEATYTEHTMYHRKPWLDCRRSTCLIARPLLPY